MRDRFDFGAINPDAFAEIDSYVDSFSKAADIESVAVLGNPEYIEKPFFTVIVPTYKRDRLLKEALESVVSQDIKDLSWNCLVMDNTPPDALGNTPAMKIIKELNDGRITYYRNALNIGSGYNWNRGAELARGEWVVFLHDDDIMYPDALTNLARIISVHDGGKPELGYIHARRENSFGAGQAGPARRSRVRYYEPLTRLRSLIRGESGTGMPTCGTAALRKAYIETGGVNYDFGPTADAIVGYRIMKKYRVIVSDVSLGARRWSESETIKESTLRALIKSDYLFARYRYSQTPFSRAWGRIFGNTEYNENLRYKRNIAKATRADSESISDFFEKERKRSCFAVFALYKALQRVHFAVSVCNAALHYKYKAGISRQTADEI